MVKLYFGRYATAWEAQIQTKWGGVWFGLLFPSFWRTSRPVFFRLTDKDGNRE